MNSFDLSELKVTTNEIKLKNDRSEEKGKEKTQSSQHSTQKLKRVKMSMSEQKNQNSLTKYGFFGAPSQSMTQSQQKSSVEKQSSFSQIIQESQS